MSLMQSGNDREKAADEGPEDRKFLSGGAIKAIGLVLMVMDHLHQMFANQGVPGWFYWFGRPVAAMFLFLCAEGFHYTHNKKVYLLRFLGAFILMNQVNRLLSGFLYVENVMLINNMFGTLFMSAFYMLMIDFFREGIREKKAGRILLALGGSLLPLAAGFILIFLALGGGRPNPAAFVLISLIPTLFTVEGGFPLVLLGAGFYLLRRFHWIRALIPVAMGLLAVFTGRGENGMPNPQGLMLFAAVPILLYNGRRGRGGKYFFYAFYPGHIYLFYIVSWLLYRFSLP